MSDDIMHIDDQLKILDDHAVAAKNLMIAMAGYNMPKVHAMMIERTAEVGLEDYGDASFRKTVEELSQECLEEFADALFYCCLILHLKGK